MGERSLYTTLVCVFVLLCLGALVSHPARAAEGPMRWSPDRVWNGRAGDDGAVHALGNGRLCVYAQGPDLIQVFGPTYSTTTVGRVEIAETDGMEVRSRRAWGTAVWESAVTVDGRPVARFTDFVDAELPCFVRHVVAEAPVSFEVTLEEGLDAAENGEMIEAKVDGAMLVCTPIGRPSVPFGRYPIPFPFFHQFAWRGAVTGELGMLETADGETPRHTLRLTIAPGESWIYIAGGPLLPECIEHAEQSLSLPYVTLKERTLAWWNAFTAEGTNFEVELPESVPMRGRLVQVLDDVSVMIKAQQGVEGGILAGYPYHLAYVRDQYGTYRGLWALGHEEMARGILGYYANVFERSGQIRNAQAFGIEGLFHVHENDDVEITGYIMLQAFHYLEQSGDTAFIERIYPMLEWAWEAQKQHLVRDMLPFNGDETYVAGGILPRTALNDGSAEATLLFLDSGAKFLDWVAAQGTWDEARLVENRVLLARVRGAFRDNFWRDGHLITNNPARLEEPGSRPRFRHGVCEGCNVVQWTMVNANDRYICITCMEKAPVPRVAPEVFDLQSVSLTPLYFGSPLFEKTELRPVVDRLVAEYQRSGRLPSRPGLDVAVGYDYGLLLYAMTETGHPDARELFEKTLSLADSTGAWSEYYQSHRPRGTRCRPWESGINVEALLHWVNTAYGTD